MATALFTCRTPRRGEPSRRRQRGFTLIESAIVMAIVGLGCVGMLQLLAAGTMANGDATEMTTALMLANNIREATQDSSTFSFTSPSNPTHWGLESGESATNPAAWDDLDDFDGAAFNPPIDARRQPLGTYTNWTQSVTVVSVDPNRIWSVMSHASVSPDQRPLSRVTVTISHAGHTVATVQWHVAYAP